VLPAAICNDVFCTKDSLTFLENQRILSTTAKQINVLKDLGEESIQVNLFKDQKIEQLDLAYFYS
jgi:hypothetical protein